MAHGKAIEFLFITKLLFFFMLNNGRGKESGILHKAHDPFSLLVEKREQEKQDFGLRCQTSLH